MTLYETLTLIIISLSGIGIPSILWYYNKKMYRLKLLQIKIKDEHKYQQYMQMINNMCIEGNIQVLERLDLDILDYYRILRPHLNELYFYLKYNKRISKIKLSTILDIIHTYDNYIIDYGVQGIIKYNDLEIPIMIPTEIINNISGNIVDDLNNREGSISYEHDHINNITKKVRFKQIKINRNKLKDS